MTKQTILDVTDKEKRMMSLIQSVNQIYQYLVFLGLEYINKVSGKMSSGQNDNYFKLRDSIYYRLGSVIFHLKLLQAVQNNQLKKLSESPFNEEEKQKMFYNGREEQFQLFDSIVFHSISLFDYIGNLIDYICNNKGQMNLKWNGVIKSINDIRNPLFKSPISPILNKLHNDFVNRLYEHRSDLIHYSKDTGGASISHNVFTNESKFIVLAPERIIKKFIELKQLVLSNRLTLNYVAFWIADQTVKVMMILNSPLLEHIQLNRKVPPGSEIFSFSDPSNPLKI